MGYDFGLEGRKTRRKGCNDEDFFVQGYDFRLIKFSGAQFNEPFRCLTRTRTLTHEPSIKHELMAHQPRHRVLASGRGRHGQRRGAYQPGAGH
jgi:hypothetical protein